MTEQERRGLFFAKTGRLASSEPVMYRAFLIGIDIGAEEERKECAEICRKAGAAMAWGSGLAIMARGADK